VIKPVIDPVIELCIQDFFSCDNAQEPLIPEALWQKWFQTWLTALQPQLRLHPLLSQQNEAGKPPTYELSLRLTDDAEIQILNRHYRQIDRPTDVLAFAALEDSLGIEAGQSIETDEPLYLGDLVISVETAQRQAGELGHPLKTELAWLSVHGFLHLLGWDHLDREQLRQMLNQQSKLLDLVNISVQMDKYLADEGESHLAK
jgi:probable rRNA maturation factor